MSHRGLRVGRGGCVGEGVWLLDGIDGEAGAASLTPVVMVATVLLVLLMLFNGGLG